MLFPLLWKHVEGCNLFYRHPVHHRCGSDRIVPLKNGLYAQCTYLTLNPTIAAYVQYVYSCVHSDKTHELSLCRALSVDLRFTDAPKDLMTKFVDCLVRLPNLRTLEIFSASHISLVTRGLKRKCARFTSIRELWISNILAKFVGSCPNVESVIVTDGLSRDGAKTLSSYGKELKRLKRVVGVYSDQVWQGELRDTFWSEADAQRWRITEVVQGCPDLREICIKGAIRSVHEPVSPRVRSFRDSHTYRLAQADIEPAEHLRSLKHLAVVDIDFIIVLPYPKNSTEWELDMAQTETELEAWRRQLIKVLKDSSSKERKFLRWKVYAYDSQRCHSISGGSRVAVEGELEVLPETSS
jgi:hypothetical protein